MTQEKYITSASIMYPSLYIDGHHNHEAFLTRETKYLDALPKELLSKSLITYAILLLSMFKEEVLEKTETKEIILNIPDAQFLTLMGNLVQSDGEKYKIGELSFNDKKEILDLIRNKLLHGDYYLDGNNIVLISGDLEGNIDSKDLTKMCSHLIAALSYKFTGKNHRPITLFKASTIDKNEDINTPEDLKKLMRDVKFFNFADEPEEGYTRTEEYVNTLQEFFSELHSNDHLLLNNTMENFVDIIYNKFKPALKKHHIRLTYIPQTVADMEDFNKIEEFFVENKEHFGFLSVIQKREFLTFIASNILQNNGNDFLLTASAISNNMMYLNSYLNNENPTKNKFHKTQSAMFADDMTIANIFNVFYSLYHYELDEIYSNGKLTKLEEIITGKYINFALLQIDKLDDPGMDMEILFEEFSNHLIKILDQVEESNQNRLKQDEILKNYFIKAKKKTEEAEKRLKENCKRAENDFIKNVLIAEGALSFMKDDFKKYKRNYNIIAHIRNAFAHGNVRILPHVKGDTLLDREIIISDIYNGKVTYTITIKYRDFIELTNENNLNYLRHFINNKICSISGMTETIEKGIPFVKTDKK